MLSCLSYMLLLASFTGAQRFGIRRPNGFQPVNGFGSPQNGFGSPQSGGFQNGFGSTQTNGGPNAFNRFNPRFNRPNFQFGQFGRRPFGRQQFVGGPGGFVGPQNVGNTGNNFNLPPGLTVDPTTGIIRPALPAATSNGGVAPVISGLNVGNFIVDPATGAITGVRGPNGVVTATGAGTNPNPQITGTGTNTGVLPNGPTGIFALTPAPTNPGTPSGIFTGTGNSVSTGTGSTSGTSGLPTGTTEGNTGVTTGVAPAVTTGGTETGGTPNEVTGSNVGPDPGYPQPGPLVQPLITDPPTLAPITAAPTFPTRSVISTTDDPFRVMSTPDYYSY